MDADDALEPAESGDRLKEENERLRAENEHLRGMLGLAPGVLPDSGEVETPRLFPEDSPLPEVHGQSPAAAKIGLFRALFRGRNDVYARFWSDERSGKKGYSPATAGFPKGRSSPKSYLPLTDDALYRHLAGEHIVGIYPLLHGDTCFFLACDFDGATWAPDALSFMEAADRWRVPVYLERSRSGQGGHVWIFFTRPVTAVQARRLGASLLRETMVARAEMELASYDRLFPNQDFMPKGGFGNLIMMRCGPVRHRFEEGAGGPGSQNTALGRRLIVRETVFDPELAEEPAIQEVYRALIEDDERNHLICADVRNALAGGACCLVLTEWREHLARLVEELEAAGVSGVVLHGGLKKKERQARIALLKDAPRESPTLVLATGQLVGEGFDLPRLDTLFLPFPISFKGKIIQYVGRVLRSHPEKTTVTVFDYDDGSVPVLTRMQSRRQKTLHGVGFVVDTDGGWSLGAKPEESPRWGSGTDGGLPVE
jgi:hypothetical protein